MTGARRLAIWPALAAVAGGLMSAGCGSGVAGQQRPAATAVQRISMNTATATASGGTWAAVVMGGLASRHEDFWQLFTRPAGSTRWRLVTPPGTADNGGLVLSAGNGQTAVTAFRPSQLLTYTPLISTADGGTAWSAVSPLDAALATEPSALASQPGTGRLLAITAKGGVEQASAGSVSWRQVTTARGLGSKPAGRRCGLARLTAAAYTPSVVLLGGACRKTGALGLFRQDGASWQATGPALPASITGQRVSVLRLVTTGRQVTAVLQAGTGHDACVLGAWLNSRGRWAISQPFPLDGASVRSASIGPAGAVAITTATRAAALIGSAGGSWQALPRLPAGTVTLAAGPGDAVQALAVSRSTLVIWQQTRTGGAWARVQMMQVPIQYGSSG